MLTGLFLLQDKDSHVLLMKYSFFQEMGIYQNHLIWSKLLGMGYQDEDFFLFYSFMMLQVVEWVPYFAATPGKTGDSGSLSLWHTSKHCRQDPSEPYFLLPFLFFFSFLFLHLLLYALHSSPLFYPASLLLFTFFLIPSHHQFI